MAFRPPYIRSFSAMEKRIYQHGKRLLANQSCISPSTLFSSFSFFDIFLSFSFVGELDEYSQELVSNLANLDAIECAENISQDVISNLLIPRDWPEGYVPITSDPNGDCMFNSVSALLTEVDAYSGILRFAACKELQENEEWYCTTVKNWGYSIWALSSDLLLPDEHSEHEIFSAEINFCRQSGRDGSLLLMWGLASVLKRPIRSIYPEVRAEDIRQLLNRTLPPRVPNGKPEIVLMWTSCVNF